MIKNILTEDGKLVDELLPAVYFDSSVIIDYYSTEGYFDHEEHQEIDIEPYVKGEDIPDELNERVTRQIEIENHPHEFLLREILKADNKLKNLSELREKILYGENKITPVFSPLAITELIKWFTDALFKELASDTVGTKAIQRYGSNQVGDYLKIIWDRINSDLNNDDISKWKKQGLKNLQFELFMSQSFVYHHGLEGLLRADIINFELTNSRAWSEPALYSYLQVGAADIMHILFAEHLGCEFIATTDQDFKRAADIIKEHTGIAVLKGYSEILSIF